MCLKLRAGAVDRPHRLDIARLEALMQWPGDVPAQKDWINAAIKAEAASRPASLMSEEAKTKMLKLAATARDLADLQDDARARHRTGAVAGVMLREAVGQCALSGVANLTEIMESIRAAWPVPPSPPSVKTLHARFWSPFRSVAHMYAASVDMTVWPCAVAELPTFLALAKEYQRQAESGRTKQGPIIEPGVCVAIPDLAGLPAVSLDFEWKAAS